MREERDDVQWWSGGLYFSCVSCGACCGGYPGTVCFTDEEERAMADVLGIDVAEFKELYVWRKYGKLSLRERSNYDCCFLRRGRCLIYSARPFQCRTFPFWPEILSSEAAWERFAASCPGMNDGLFHDKREIEAYLSQSAFKNF